jgi:hypothetical protein
MGIQVPDPAPMFRLTFRALPGSVPAEIRLRHLLKTAGRRDGLRCVKAEELTDGYQTEETARAGEGGDA